MAGGRVLAGNYRPVQKGPCRGSASTNGSRSFSRSAGCGIDQQLRDARRAFVFRLRHIGWDTGHIKYEARRHELIRVCFAFDKLEILVAEVSRETHEAPLRPFFVIKVIVARRTFHLRGKKHLRGVCCTLENARVILSQHISQRMIGHVRIRWLPVPVGVRRLYFP